MGPNGGPASVGEVTQQEIDEELLNKMTTLKVETLNSGASQKVASFYRSVTDRSAVEFLHFWLFQEAPVIRRDQPGEASHDQLERFHLKKKIK